jgi:hypothetical protein
MATRKSQSNQIEGKIALFKGITELVEYARELTKDEHRAVQERTLVYLSQRSPDHWNANEIQLILVLSRLEAQMSKLTEQHTKYLSQDVLSEADLKAIKMITQSCSGISTQMLTLTPRLGLSAAQLHGGSLMRSERLNDNSRAIADLVLSKQINPSAQQANSLDEARALARQHLESMT